MLLFIAELKPFFISQPLNSSSVLEGQNLTLQWNYNLTGQANAFTRIIKVSGGSETGVASRSGTAIATVAAGYENQFIASISDTEAILTILAVPRSVNEEKYRLLILAASNTLTSVDVDISVLCEYKAYCRKISTLVIAIVLFQSLCKLTALQVKKVHIPCFSSV